MSEHLAVVLKVWMNSSQCSHSSFTWDLINNVDFFIVVSSCSPSCVQPYVHYVFEVLHVLIEDQRRLGTAPKLPLLLVCSKQLVDAHFAAWITVMRGKNSLSLSHTHISHLVQYHVWHTGNFGQTKFGGFTKIFIRQI